MENETFEELQKAINGHKIVGHGRVYQGEEGIMPHRHYFYFALEDGTKVGVWGDNSSFYHDEEKEHTE